MKKIKLLKKDSKLRALPEKEAARIRKLMEGDEDEVDQEEEDELEADDQPTKKRKRVQKVDEASRKRKKADSGKPVEAGGDRKKKKKEKAVKAAKAVRPKKVKVPVDKSDPNWRLKPNPKVTVWEKDPMFESKTAETSLPFVSSTSNSRLVISAVLTKGTCQAWLC